MFCKLECVWCFSLDNVSSVIRASVATNARPVLSSIASVPSVQSVPPCPMMHGSVQPHWRALQTAQRAKVLPPPPPPPPPPPIYCGRTGVHGHSAAHNALHQLHHSSIYMCLAARVQAWRCWRKCAAFSRSARPRWRHTVRRTSWQRQTSSC